MEPDKLLPALWPLLHGFGINQRGLAPAQNYEFEIGCHTLFVAVESSGQVLLVTPLSRGTTGADDDLGWRILNQNTLGQPAPMLIHSTSESAEEVLLWCEFSLLTLPSDQLRALPERFLARLHKTQSLLEGLEPNDPGLAEQTAAKPRRRRAATATQLRERLDRQAA